MDSNYTHTTIVLDRSGSMSSICDDTIGGFNTLLREQQAIPGKATFSLLQFDHEFERVFDFADVAHVPLLTGETFVPRGTTALRDAIGQAITETCARLAALPEEERPGKVILVIITDGLENASREYSHAKVAGMIRHQEEKYGWKVVYTAANQDAFEVGEALNMRRGNTRNFLANEAGTEEMFSALSTSLRSARLAPAVSFQSMGFFESEANSPTEPSGIAAPEPDNKKA